MEYKEHEYRVKKMNAIKILSFRSLFNFEDLDSTAKLYETFLENVEVNINDKWLPVKSGNVYLPNGIEEDIQGIDALINFFAEYLKSVFPKSNN